jgi:hypothetical protein
MKALLLRPRTAGAQVNRTRGASAGASRGSLRRCAARRSVDDRGVVGSLSLTRSLPLDPSPAPRTDAISRAQRG